MNQLLFLQLVSVAVSAQGIDLSQLSFAPSMVDQAVAVGLAQPTSPAIYPKITSPEVWTSPKNTAVANGTHSTYRKESEETSGQAGGVLNVLGSASDGDLHGANPRQNMVYFGMGRHGFGVGAECDGCLDPCDDANEYDRHPIHGYPEPNRKPECAEPIRPVAFVDPNRPVGRPEPKRPVGCVEPKFPVECPEPNRQVNQPYLKVTPTLKIQAFTRTHVETRTSAIYDIHTSLHTRTVTDEIRSTSTDYVHPEKTYTYVDYQTVYEYPAATIDASNIQRAHEADIHRQVNKELHHC